LIADSTSRVAASMLRLKPNCSVMLTWPSVLCEVISVTAEIRPYSRSSGVATDEAMISGLAPGKDAEADMVGKSTCGNGDTGSTRKAEAPDNTKAAVRSVVAMGRLMKGAEKFTAMSEAAVTPVAVGCAARKVMDRAALRPAGARDCAKRRTSRPARRRTGKSPASGTT